ncbi:unnamed protein product [Phytophthora lilii]|uniref:Unnamed protein product n=1 Tax=Phytophthora lilii TaxID=2077276 RepID=A0A9W6UCE1_9STRA|nr:unnamed protein product [Phytophthora lilii]
MKGGTEGRVHEAHRSFHSRQIIHHSHLRREPRCFCQRLAAKHYQDADNENHAKHAACKFEHKWHGKDPDRHDRQQHDEVAANADPRDGQSLSEIDIQRRKEAGGLLQTAQREQHEDEYLWQMVDSLYPTGGFAHSLGLEAAAQEGLVAAASLRAFLSASLHQSANFALPLVCSAHAAAADADVVEAALRLNGRATALYSNHVARKASLAQGAALLRLALSTYAPTWPRMQALLALRKQAKKRGQGGVHHAVLFGLVCALLGVDAEPAQRMYLFVTTRDVLSAATRLNLVGPLEAAKLQYEIAPLLEQVFQAKKNRGVEDSYSSAPVLDLVQAMHDQLYTRIFNS